MNAFTGRWHGKLNHMICPRCGHDFYIDTAYATCDACQTFFYASQSRTSKVTIPVTNDAENFKASRS